MSITNFGFRIRHQSLWSNPKRKIQTLESFSQTEIDAGESILSALAFVTDPELRLHLRRHADDELRHGKLFLERAQELRKQQPNTTSIFSKPDKLYHLTNNNIDEEINSHGFFTGACFEKLGEIMYVAMLNVAEKRAEKTFSMHHNLIQDDLHTSEIFKRILKDERYHVSYTAKFLQRWEKEGRKKEVRKAVSLARRSRVLNTLTRNCSKFGEHMGHAILYIIYFTIVFPFAMFSKLSRSKKGWITPIKNTDQNQIHSQY